MGNVRRQTWLLTYILLPLIRALDWLLCKRHFGLRLLDPERIITRRLDPRRLIKKARAIAGDGPFHLPYALVEDRLRRAQSGAARRESEGIGGARRSGRGPARRRRLGAAADARARRGPAGHARGRAERRLFHVAAGRRRPHHHGAAAVGHDALARAVGLR